MINITKTIHYAEDDTDFSGDYYSINLEVRVDDKLIFEGYYGDYYHDKGKYKVDAVLNFIETVMGKFSLKVIKLADGVC